MSFTCKNPVLVCTFNRPELTRRVLEAVRAVSPPALYLACDGPRSDADRAAIEAIREMASADQFSFPVLTRFAESNQGCGKGIFAALGWFFGCVDQGIVLEDDTLPSTDFFRFCDEMLHEHKADERIHAVCGAQLLPPVAKRLSGDAAFSSKYFLCWGWASWARCLPGFEVSRPDWQMSELDSIADQMGMSLFEKDFWKTQFLRAFRGEIDTWDYQFLYNAWRLQRRMILPAVNLVSNIGFGEGATHTVNAESNLSQLQCEPLAAAISTSQDIELSSFLEDLRFYYIYNQHWSASGAAEYSRRADSQYLERLRKAESLIQSPISLMRHYLKNLFGKG